MVIFIGVLVGFIYKSFSHKNYDKQECSASITVFYKNAVANINLNYMYSLSDKTGVVAINGNYIENQKAKGRIRRDISYDWKENKDTYHLHSIKVSKFEMIDNISDELLANILPDFYVYPNENVSYTILNQASNAFIFSIGKRPIFYCAH